MSVVAWRTDVNTNILDSTTIETGENGFKEDSTESGFKQRYATSLVCSDIYQVTMDFDWLIKDENGLSEFDRFKNWFKYVHQNGSNPFWFESIERFNIHGPVRDENGNPLMCLYAITSKLSFVKSGFCMRCTMTWKEVYNGLIEIPEETSPSIDHISAVNGKIFVQYTSVLTYRPTPSDFEFKYCSLLNGDGSSLSQYKSFPNVYRAYLDSNTAVYSVSKLPSGSYKIILDNDIENFCTLVVE